MKNVNDDAAEAAGASRISLVERVRRMIFGHQPTKREFAARAVEAEERHRLSLAYMRALEAQLTPGQRNEAFAIMRANGWEYGSTPPMWVWAEVYRRVLDKSAVASRQASPERSEGTQS